MPEEYVSDRWITSKSKVKVQLKVEDNPRTGLITQLNIFKVSHLLEFKLLLNKPIIQIKINNTMYIILVYSIVSFYI
jgi:hypothetical protein